MSCDRCGKPTPPLVSDGGGFYGGVGSVCSCGGIHRPDEPELDERMPWHDEEGRNYVARQDAGLADDDSG